MKETAHMEPEESEGDEVGRLKVAVIAYTLVAAPPFATKYCVPPLPAVYALGQKCLCKTCPQTVHYDIEI